KSSDSELCSLPVPLFVSALLQFIFKMNQEVSDFPLKNCLICSTSISVPYYGIDACRACASFFKRSKLSGKKYVCRQGERKCVIAKDEKFCRRCRFDRCVATGMVYQRPIRGIEENGMQTEQSEPLCPQSSTISTNCIGPSTSVESAEPVLQRIGRLFSASVERRRIKELHLLQNQPDSSLVPHPSQEIFLSNYATSLLTFEIMHAESRPIYEKAFPAIKKLSKEERNLLCKSYIPKFCLIDNA
ncbi:hypothetical protein PFISCL1PPCAC_13700, partial [Pristionchus fissidentatus]